MTVREAVAKAGKQLPAAGLIAAGVVATLLSTLPDNSDELWLIYTAGIIADREDLLFRPVDKLHGPAFWPNLPTLRAKFPTLWPRSATFWRNLATFWAFPTTFWRKNKIPKSAQATFWPNLATLWAKFTTFWHRPATFWANLATFWPFPTTFWRNLSTLWRKNKVAF